MKNTESIFWIKQQFNDASLKDKRLKSRLNIIASNMIAKPNQSIPKQNGGWKETKAAYRFFDSRKVSFQKLARPHINETTQEAKNRKIVLAVQDTTHISYSHHSSVEGLTNIGGPAGEKGNGIILHSTLAVDPTKTYPEVIGLLDQYIHNRRKPKPQGWKESMLWIEASNRINLNNSNTQLIEVMDREADVFNIMQNCLHLKHDFIIRAANDRVIDAPQGGKFFDCVRQLHSSGTVELDVKKRHGQKKRKALLDVCFSRVKILGPKTRKNEVIECSVVRVIERKPPRGQEPLEWVLLTSLRVDSFKDSCRVVDWYKCRWIIEEYHKCIKTGCGVEKKQFKQEFRIENFLGVANVVAVRLLQLRSHARNTPKTPAKKVIEPLKVDILLKYKKIPKKDVSVYEYYRLIASLGGFLGRKSDGEPGWQTLWFGEVKLSMLVEGARMAIEGG